MQGILHAYQVLAIITLVLLGRHSTDSPHEIKKKFYWRPQWARQGLPPKWELKAQCYLKCFCNLPQACWTHLFLIHSRVSILSLNHVLVVFIGSSHLIITVQWFFIIPFCSEYEKTEILRGPWSSDDIEIKNLCFALLFNLLNAWFLWEFSKSYKIWNDYLKISLYSP